MQFFLDLSIFLKKPLSSKNKISVQGTIPVKQGNKLKIFKARNLSVSIDAAAHEHSIHFAISHQFYLEPRFHFPMIITIIIMTQARNEKKNERTTVYLPLLYYTTSIAASWQRFHNFRQIFYKCSSRQEEPFNICSSRIDLLDLDEAICTISVLLDRYYFLNDL